MVQGFNLAGIKSAWHTLRRPSLAMPHYIVPTLASIDFAGLRRGGVRAVAFDKDNTLTRPYEDELEGSLKDAWAECKEEFGPDRMVIVSNSAGTRDDPGGRWAGKAERGLGVRVLRHDAKKPDGGETLLAHFPDLAPREIVVVGDRVLTDVVYGHRMGGVTILTEKVLSLRGDNLAAVWIRRMEKVWLRWAAQRGVEPATPRPCPAANVVRSE